MTTKTTRVAPGTKMRDAEKMALIPIKVVETTPETRLRKPNWLRIKLPKSSVKIDKIKARRREIVNYYNAHFSGIEEFILPYEDESVNSNFHLYILQVKENTKFDRYDLFNHLQSLNYSPMVHYIPVHLLSYYRKSFGYKRGDFPVAEKVYDRSISIPLYPSLTDLEVEKVVKDIVTFVKET
mgnify:CR=1 FL=1